MYYPELLEIINKTGAKEAIEKLDKYLAFLTNRSEKVITPSNIATQLELDFNIVNMIFEYIYDLGLFKKVYIVVCPECEREILVSDQRQLMDKVKELDFCSKCKEQIKITPEDIYVGYKLIKQPDLDQDEMILETKKLLGKSNKENMVDGLETLEEMFKKNKESPHDFFYNPSEADRQSLIESFNNLDLDYKSSKDQGGALEGLACKLFNICKGLTATTDMNTITNQIDCTVRNDYFIPLTVYKELGSIVKAECKNEPNKVPGNTYFHKLCGIIETSKSRNEQAVGILFSRKKAAKTCKDLARQYFLKDNIIIINIFNYDLNRIIIKNANFLDVLQEKIQYVKNNFSTDPEKHKLYRKRIENVI